jgi:hypothetical protein
MNRIIRTKFLYRAAVSELDSGHPFAAGMAISLLQDAVEAMAHEAAASVNAEISARANFLDHWVAVAKVGNGKTLPDRVQMADLNAARVAFKHQGVNPSLAEAEKQRLSARRFLTETAREFFSVDFDDISEADLITSIEIKSAVKAAEAALTASEATKSLECCKDALDVVEKLMRDAVVVTEKSNSGPSIPREAREAAAGVLKWVNRRFAALEMSVALSVLRINPADYWFLYQTLPQRVSSGKIYWPPTRSVVSTRTHKRAQACIRIIIELALRVERVHADMQRLGQQAGLADERRQLKELLEQQHTEQPPSDDPPPGSSSE